MSTFELPKDLSFNRGPVADPQSFARDAGAKSWLCLTGDEFAAMPGGLSYDQIAASVPESVQIVSDPPVTLDLDLGRQHVAALDRLARPTLVTCRTGPRASAVAYMYAGLKAGANATEVLAAADRDQAPFCANAAYRDWVRECLETFSGSADG